MKKIIVLIRRLAINTPPIFRSTFVYLCCCRNGRIAGYTTVTTTAKADKKASDMGGLFVVSCLTILLAGCSANRVQLEPQLSNGQTVTYARGNVKINSQPDLKSELAVLEYSSDEMLIGITVTNSTAAPIIISEKNLAVDLLSEGEFQAGIIYSFEVLAEEAADKGYDVATQVGSTAVGIGVGFIPFGGIAYSVGKLFYSIGSQQGAESYGERVDRLAFSQLNNYFRQQTIDPEESYSGVLKIGFEDDIEAGDAVIFSLSIGDEVEKFNFSCEQSKEK